MEKNGFGSSKKVILIVIDSFIPETLRTCLTEEVVPGIEYLSKKGSLRYDCVSVFPTMTPTATASIATGVYPDRHGIPGFIWYHRGDKRIINYGATPLAILKAGFKTVLKDLLCRLNGEHLSRDVKTVHEILEDNGLSSANINFYIFRGRHLFDVNLPWWARLLGGLRVCTQILGPSISIVGQIVPPGFPCKGALKKPGGIFRKFGVNDEFAGTVAYHLIKQGRQPDFTVVYLPDMDGYTHRHHIKDTAPAVIRADRQIQKILNAFGSWQEAVENNIFIIMGDHSQSLIGHNRESIINLSKILSRFRQVKLGRSDDGNNYLVVCPNERMAHIYILKDFLNVRNQVIGILSAEEGIDQIMWSESSSGKTVYHVVRGGSGKALTFIRGGPVHDPYGVSWEIEGDLTVVDARIENNLLVYRDYPDALNVMAALMSTEHCGDITITARPGFEFDGEAAPIHPGKGSHGSFHRNDICVPLIISGADMGNNPRLVDVVPFILKNFGLTF